MTLVKDNTITIAAIAVIAMCFSTVAHEVVGHGGLCLVTGGRITQLTSVYFQCTPGQWPIALAGPVGNLIWALIAAAIGANLRGGLRLFFALTALFSLLWEAGYMLYAAIVNDGDYVFALRGMFGGTTPLMRGVLAALGAGLYFIALNMGRTLLRPFATDSVRVRKILRTAWIAATLAAVVAALFYAPDRFGAFKQAFLEIGVASAALMLLRREYSGGDAPPIRANPLWWLAAAGVYVVFVLKLGVGAPP